MVRSLISPNLWRRCTASGRGTATGLTCRLFLLTPALRRASWRSEIEFSVSPPPAGLRAQAHGPQKTKKMLFWPLHDRYMTVTRPLLPLHCAAGETARPGEPLKSYFP